MIVSDMASGISASGLLAWVLQYFLLTFFGVSTTTSALATGASPAAWAPQSVLVQQWSAVYNWTAARVAGQTVAAGARLTNAGNIYACIVGGTCSAGAGPTGTGTGISDGAGSPVTWNYVASATADGYGIVAPSSGTGRWVIAPGTAIHWTGQSADDGPALQAATTSLAPLGGRIVLWGLVQVGTRITTPNTGAPSIFHLAGNCEVRAAITGAALFYADSQGPAVPPPGGAVTIVGSPNAGATTFTVTPALNGLAAGNTIAVANNANNYVSTAVIRSVNSGTNQVTIWEPLSVPPPSGASVYVLPGLACLKITGDPGSRLTGSAMQGIEILCGRYCEVRGITIAMAFSGALPWAVYFDWATRDSLMSNCTIVADATNAGTTAVGAEQCVNLIVENVRVIQSANRFGGAFISTTGTNVWFVDCWAPGSNVGWSFDVTDASNVFGQYGHHGSGAVGCHAPDSTYAFTVKNGGQGIVLRDCTAPRSTNWGVAIYAPDTGVYPNSVSVIGGDYSNGALYGVTISGGDGHLVSGPNLSNCLTGIQFNGGSASAVGFHADACSGPAVQITGGDIAMSNVWADNCTSSIHGAFYVTGGNNAHKFTNIYARGATYTGLDFQPASASLVLDVNGADITGSGSSGNGCAVLYGGRITMTNVSTGYRSDPGAGTRFGLQLGGTADVTLVGVTAFTQPTPGGNRVAVSLNVSTVVLRMTNVRIVSTGSAGSNGGASYGLICNQNGTVFDLGAVDFSAAGGNAYILGSSKTNFGSVTMNGATGVTISNVVSPGAYAVFGTNLTTAGGTPAAVSQLTAISGNSFQVVSLPGNTSTYAWRLA